MKIYLDVCCFNRPFDDQLKMRIKLETEAKLKIQEDIRAGLHQLIWSYILDYENSKNPFPERRQQIAAWRKYAADDMVEDDDIIHTAATVNQQGIRKIDSLHIACAIKAKADYFLTTDDGILKKLTLIQDLRVINPIGFIKEVSV